MLRRERFGCVQLFDHYLYLIETLINFSVQVRLRVTRICLPGGLPGAVGSTVRRRSDRSDARTRRIVQQVIHPDSGLSVRIICDSIRFVLVPVCTQCVPSPQFLLTVNRSVCDKASNR